MQQDRLFYDTTNAAMTQVVNALGGPLVVGKQLWPTKPDSYCEQKVANCLNPNHDWKFELEEWITILQLAREAGIHFAMHKFCEDVGYEAPEIARTKTPEQKIAEQMVHVAGQYQRLADELATLNRTADARELRKIHDSAR